MAFNTKLWRCCLSGVGSGVGSSRWNDSQNKSPHPPIGVFSQYSKLEVYWKPSVMGAALPVQVLDAARQQSG